MQHFPSFPLAEIVADQCADRLDRLHFVGTFDFECNLRALAAASIITPMMLFALTLRPLREICTSL
jgi:hypothetical protein